jgi:hypothetical protein
MSQRIVSSLMSSLAQTSRAAVAVYPVVRAPSTLFLAIAAALFSRHGARDDIYNVLWAVVFGFATLNILSLAARHFEPTRRGLTFGELLAVLVVVISLFLLGWEMLTVFHIFPIKLKPS